MREFFEIKEVVCPHVLNRHGEQAWRLFDPRIITVMAWIRRKIGKRIFVNRYAYGLTQRGLRCNLCQLVKDKTEKGIVYVSPHLLAAGMDFDIEGMAVQQVHDWLEANKAELPHPIRLEKDVTWVHLDVLSNSSNKISYIWPS